MFVTLLGALLVRHQFVLGYHPRISYKSGFFDNSNDTWQVKILNVGLGPAIFNKIRYELELADSESIKSAAFREILSELQKSGLIRLADFKLENVSEGFTLSPKEECFLFEIKKEHMSKFNHFSVIIHFQGMLGDKYYREILFIPSWLNSLSNPA